MAVALRGTHGVSNGAAGTSASGWTAALSAAAAGVQEGDLMAVTVHLRAGGITAPAGWTQRVVGSSFVGSPYWQYAVVYIFTKVATAADVGATFNFQFSMQYASSAHLVAYSGAGRVTPIVGTALNQSDAYVTNRPAGSVTATWDAGTWTLSAYTALGAVAASVGTGTKRAGARQADSTTSDQVESWVSDHSGAPSTAQSLSWPSGVVAASASIAIAPRYSETPTTPTPLSPANASFQPAGLVITLEADFTDPDSGDTPSAYAARIKPSGGAYEWIDASGALVPTETWVPWTVDTLAAAIDALELTPGTTYNWSFAAKDSLGTPSSYHSDRTFTTAAPPDVIATGPDGTQTTTRPTGTWSYSSGGQTHYRAKFFTDAVVSGSGFDPDTSPAVASSGLAASTTAREWQTTVDLTNGSYWFFIQVVENGVESEWESIAFDVELTPATAPAEVVVTPEPELARIAATVVAPARYLDATTAAVEMQRRIGDADWSALTPTEGVDFASWIMADATLALLAETYDPDVAPFWRDESGNGHHARMGSTWPAYVARGEFQLPGQTNNHALATDAATQDGDSTVCVRAVATDWTPPFDRYILSRWPAWALRLNSTTGLLTYQFNSGTFVVSTMPVPVADGDAVWLRVRRDSTTGSITFYWCPDQPTKPTEDQWQQLGVPVVAAAGAHAGGAPLAVGSISTVSGGTGAWAGRVLYADIAPSVEDDAEPDVVFDPSGVADFATSWVSETGETWAVQWPGARIMETGGGMVLPGTTGAYASVPDELALRVTGDSEWEWHGTVASLTPAALQYLLSKYATVAGGRMLGFQLATTGAVAVTGSTDGTSGTTVTSTATLGSVGYAAGDDVQIKVDRRQSDGRVRIWHRAASTDAWAQLGTDLVLHAGAALYAANSQVEVGSFTSGANALAGTTDRAIIRDGIGGDTVLDIDFTEAEPYTRSFVCATGQRVTLNGQTGADTNDPTWLDYDGEQYVYLPGVVGNYLSVPDNPALRVPGDLALVFDGALDDWTPAADQVLVNKWMQTGGQRSYQFAIANGTLGLPRFRLSVDGATTLTYAANAAPNVVDGAAIALGVTRNGTTGDIKFWTAPSGTTTHPGGAGWTQLGTTVAGTTSALYANTAPCEVGAEGGTGTTFSGKVYAVRIYGSIDGTNKVLDIDTSDTDRWDPTVVSAWKAMPIPAARTTFTRATAAYLDGVEVASGTPRYPRGRNLLTANQASLETDLTGWITGGSTVMGRAATAWDGSVALALTATAAGVWMTAYTLNTTNGGPIVAGRTYTASAYFRAAAGTPNVQVELLWYTAAGVYIGPNSGGAAPSSPDTWTRRTVTAAAPAGAAFCAVRVYAFAAAIGDVHYVDGVQIEEGAVATAWRPGGPSAVLIEEGTTNLLTANQSDGGEDGTTGGWGAGGSSSIASSTDRSWQGTRSIKATANAAGASILVAVNTPPALTAVPHTISAWVYAPASNTATAVILSDDGTFVGASYAVASNVKTSVKGGWVRMVWTITPNAADLSGLITFRLENAAIGDVVYIDGVQVEAKAYPTSWHIGGGTRNGEVAYLNLGSWTTEGTAVFDFDKRAPGPGNQRFIEFGTYANPRSAQVWQNSDGSIGLFIWKADNSGWFSTPTLATLPVGRNKLVLSWSAANWKVWLNGTLIGTVAKEDASMPATARIGLQGIPGVMFDHDNVQVFDRRLSDAEVAALTTTAPETNEDTVWLQDFRSTLEGEYGQVTTLNRSTSGKKLAVVNRKLLLFGADDYAEVPHAIDGSLDLDDGGTVIGVLRRYGAPAAEQVLIAKRTSSPGWSVNLQATSGDARFLLHDGTVAPNRAHPTPTGDLATVAAVRNVDTDTLQVLTDGAASATATDTTTASIASAVPLSVGRYSAAGNYADMELVGLFVFPWALTEAEMEQVAYEVGDLYGGEPYRAVTVHDETAPFHVPVEYRARVLEARE